MSKTLTIRLDDDEELNLQKVMRVTANATASGAIKNMIDNYYSLTGLYSDSTDKIVDLQNEIERLNAIIESARSSALRFVEDISQPDLIAR